LVVVARLANGCEALLRRLGVKGRWVLIIGN
jgi:hypothetical protein